jgi:hypothetical protein
MTEKVAPQITEEWLVEQAEVARNRRRNVVEFFDSSFLPHAVKELRAVHDPDLLDGAKQSDNVNHDDFIQKKEI